MNTHVSKETLNTMTNAPAVSRSLLNVTSIVGSLLKREDGLYLGGIVSQLTSRCFRAILACGTKRLPNKLLHAHFVESVY